MVRRELLQRMLLKLLATLTIYLCMLYQYVYTIYILLHVYLQFNDNSSIIVLLYTTIYRDTVGMSFRCEVHHRGMCARDMLINGIGSRYDACLSAPWASVLCQCHSASAIQSMTKTINDKTSLRDNCCYFSLQYIIPYMFHSLSYSPHCYYETVFLIFIRNITTAPSVLS